MIKVNPLRARRRVQFDCGTETRVKQEFRDECDINVIMRRYVKTKTLTHLSSREGYFKDVSGVTDFKEALDTVKRGHDIFDELPIEVQDSFGNDPSKFLEFAGDAENIVELYQMYGIVKPKPADAPKSEAKAPKAPLPEVQQVIPDPERPDAS